MEVAWKIEKQVGIHRPILTVVVQKLPEELALGVQDFDICPEGDIALLQSSNTNIREDGTDHFRDMLDNPVRTEYTYRKQQFALPWRESGEYPEIPAMMAVLLQRWDTAVAKALASTAIDMTIVCEHSEFVQASFVAEVSARKLLGK